MDGETKQALEDVKAAVLEIDQKLSAHLEESQAEAHSTDSGGESPEEAHSIDSGDKDSANLSELQAENESLKQQVAELSSETHIRRTLQELLRGMTPEAYVDLGIKLGYSGLLAEGVPTDEADALHEVALNDVPGQPKVLFSQTLPEGEDGWIKSESLDCYVKVEE